MSLLLSEGHPEAERYPIAVVWSEARLVRQRDVQRIKTEAVVMQGVIASAFGGSKALQEIFRTLDDGE